MIDSVQLTVAPSSLPGLSPDAHIYVLAMVLIFSIPLNFGLRSNCKVHESWSGLAIDTLSKMPHLIEVTNDLVQQTQALQALFVDVRLIVELLVVGYGGEHDGHT